MKAVCIVGSPRANQSTAYLMDKVIEGIRECGIEISRYCLGKTNINFCIGCKKCYLTTGNCIHRDDMNIIMEDIISADIIVIGSPSYWGDVTGQLKVLFDRNTPYCDTNENRQDIPSGKIGMAIAVRAGASQGENQHIIQSIEHYYSHLGIKPVENLSVCAVDTLDDLLKKPESINSAYMIGKSIFKYLE